MPCEHQMSPFEASLLETCADRKKLIGFDGPFSLPDEQRVLLEAENIGSQVALMRVIKHLKLDRESARALYFGLMAEPEPQSVQEVEQFYKDLQHR